MKIFTAPQHTRFILPPIHPTKSSLRCGAVDLLGMIHGEAVFKMNTTTSCGWFWANPQKQWDLQEKYHCM